MLLHDHYVLLGPASESSYFAAGCSPARALRAICTRYPGKTGQPCPTIFHSGSDGSDSFFKKQDLWQSAGIDTSRATWDKNMPDEAIEKAAQEHRFRLTDRSLFLDRGRRRKATSMQVIVEDGRQLLKPVSVLVNSKVSDQSQESARVAQEFAEWLLSHEAQKIIQDYARNWPDGVPLFTTGAQPEFNPTEGFRGMR